MCVDDEQWTPHPTIKTQTPTHPTTAPVIVRILMHEMFVDDEQWTPHPPIKTHPTKAPVIVRILIH